MGRTLRRWRRAGGVIGCGVLVLEDVGVLLADGGEKIDGVVEDLEDEEENLMESLGREARKGMVFSSPLLL